MTGSAVVRVHGRRWLARGPAAGTRATSRSGRRTTGPSGYLARAAFTIATSGRSPHSLPQLLLKGEDRSGRIDSENRQVVDWLSTQPPWTWVALVAGVALVRLRQGARREATAQAAPRPLVR